MLLTAILFIINLTKIVQDLLWENGFYLKIIKNDINISKKEEIWLQL